MVFSGSRNEIIQRRHNLKKLNVEYDIPVSSMLNTSFSSNRAMSAGRAASITVRSAARLLPWILMQCGFFLSKVLQLLIEVFSCIQDVCSSVNEISSDGYMPCLALKHSCCQGFIELR
ncbi:hypothetical protein Plhal304r1_c020g0071841 [Plasmopara halstedii]